jgi:hypothetical protein
MEEMFPRPVQEVQTQKQTSAWIEKAKIALQTEKKVEPFNFTAAVSASYLELYYHMD